MNEEDNPFLKLFEEQWGFTPEERRPETIRELIALAQRCRKDESLQPQLNEALDDLLPKVIAIHDANLEDLEEAENVSSELLPHLEGSLDAYQQIVGAMQGMKEGEFEALEDLEAGAELLAKHQNILTRWHSGEAPACPKCGAHGQSGEKVCSTCNVHLIYADRSGTEFESVTLGPSYTAVHEACHKVASGDASFAVLAEAISAMDQELNRAHALLSRLPEAEQEKLEVPRLQALLEDSLLGLAQIRRFDDSCELADLNQGWQRLSQAGATLSGALKPLAEQFS